MDLHDYADVAMKLQLTAGNPAVKSRKTTFWGAIIIWRIIPIDKAIAESLPTQIAIGENISRKELAKTFSIK
jgi:anti-sigma-K factor RskA